MRALPTAAAATPEHVQVLAAAIDAMVAASANHSPVPPLRADACGEAATAPWLRCIAALAAVQSNLDESRLHASAGSDGAVGGASDVDPNDQVLVSSCTVDKLGASRAKHRVDALLAMHAKRTFPGLVSALVADARLVLLVLDAPNVLTTTALADAFPALRSPGLASRICIPQADPTHYSLMVTQQSYLYNVRFQRLDGWLDSNARGGIRVPIFFADYETSVYGRRSMRLSPLEDIQRFLRYGYAHSTCLVGLTLSYRELHKEHYPQEAPVLTHEDVVGFVEHEAACVGMTCTLLECYRVRRRPPANHPASLSSLLRAVIHRSHSERPPLSFTLFLFSFSLFFSLPVRSCLQPLSPREDRCGSGRRRRRGGARRARRSSSGAQGQHVARRDPSAATPARRGTSGKELYRRGRAPLHAARRRCAR